jgi:hypothetical protein
MDQFTTNKQEKTQTTKLRFSNEPVLPVKSKRADNFLTLSTPVGSDGAKVQLRIKHNQDRKCRKRSNSLLSSQTDESNQTVISKRSIQTDMNKDIPKAGIGYLEDEGLIPSSKSMNRFSLGQSPRVKDFTKKSIVAKKRNLESVSEVY